MQTRPTPSPSRIRVVVADDSAFMRHVIADGLTERGAEVVAVASDGDAALVECAQHRPDVLSLDLAMPGLDGIGVLKELRARGSDVAVVVVSAFSPARGLSTRSPKERSSSSPSPRRESSPRRSSQSSMTRPTWPPRRAAGPSPRDGSRRLRPLPRLTGRPPAPAG